MARVLRADRGVVVITIDGPSGVGKSTVTRRVAAELGLPYLDTGATYRAATLAVLQAGVDVGDGAAVLDVVRECTIDYVDGVITLQGEPVADQVRSPAVTAAVSQISAYPDVRHIVVKIQRQWVDAHNGAAVVEGRDIGTVVFPDAPVKVFLTASAKVRAMRRAGDAEAEGAAVGDIAAELERRDRHDSTRTVSPLQAADDAHVLDTSDLAVDGVVDAILSLVQIVEQNDHYGS
jgi:cytidylate kinase